MKGRASPLLVVLVAVAACGSPPPPVPSPPVASTSAPVAPASSAPPPASSSAAAPAPRLVPLDEDVKDDEPAPSDPSLVALVRRSTHVVVGRVAEGKEHRAGKSRTPFVVVAIESLLSGEADAAHPPYRKAFPLVGDTQVEGTSKSYAVGHEDPVPGLAAGVGEKRLFFVRLPGPHGEGWSEPGPPPEVLRRFGKFTVSLVGTRPVGEKDAVVKALADEVAHAKWTRENAARLAVTDRFAAASPRAAADLVARFVETDLRDVGGLAARAELDGDPVEERGHTRFTYRLTGDALATGTLRVRVATASARVHAFNVEAPFFKAQSKDPPKGSAAAWGESVRRRLELRTRGGKAFVVAHGAFRGDGVHILTLELDAGKVFTGGSTRPSKGARVVASATGVVVDYLNGWAEPG